MKIGNFKDRCEGKRFAFTFPHRERHIYFVREAWVEEHGNIWHGIVRFKKESDDGLASLPVEFRANLVMNTYGNTEPSIAVTLERDGRVVASKEAQKKDIETINSWLGFVDKMVTHATDILEPLPF